MTEHRIQSENIEIAPGDARPAADERIASHRPILDARAVRDMLGAAFVVLRQHKDEVNALNFFPVPDGDTGSNMAMTVESAWTEIADAEASRAGTLLRRFALAAIRGARGNSGVILSQIFRGMADAIADCQVIDAPALARALRQGQQAAYQGVMQPVEGTILTIMRAIADAGERAAARNKDITFLLESALAQAQETLAQTPEMLPVLKQAGVVDAGGQGLVYLLEGMTRFLRGEPITAANTTIATATQQAHLHVLGDEWGYDIQFLIYDAQADAATIRHRLDELGGNSIVVGGTGSVIKVHVHGDDPGPFLSYGASLGQMDDIVVENMTLQTLRRRGEGKDESTPEKEETVLADDFCTNVVAVAAGDGFARVFRSLGVCQVVAGGQTMNPSIEDLLHAVSHLDAAEVIILPNNKNIILAAQQAAQLCDKTVHVVETRTLPQGVAAMVAFNPELDAGKNARQMQAMAMQVRTIEITTAVRDAHINGVEVQEQSAIALVDDELCCAGQDVNEVALQALASLLAEEEADVITLYDGLPAEDKLVQQLVQQIKKRYPEMDVERIWGGQPYYHYIISVE